LDGNFQTVRRSSGGSFGKHVKVSKIRLCAELMFIDPSFLLFKDTEKPSTAVVFSRTWVQRQQLEIRIVD
jgi:hypothetical protein